MKKKSLAQWLYIVLLLADFYILPFLIKDTGSGLLLLLIVMPLLVFLGAVVYGLQYGLHWVLPLAAYFITRDKKGRLLYGRRPEIF